MYTYSNISLDRSRGETDDCDWILKSCVFFVFSAPPSSTMSQMGQHLPCLPGLSSLPSRSHSESIVDASDDVDGVD
jgi:hypothetical protein